MFFYVNCMQKGRCIRICCSEIKDSVCEKRQEQKNSIANYALDTTHPPKTIVGIFSTCLNF